MNKSKKKYSMHHACIYTYTCKDNQACIDMISSNRWQHEKNRIHNLNTYACNYRLNPNRNQLNIHDKQAMN